MRKVIVTVTVAAVSVAVVALTLSTSLSAQTCPQSFVLRQEACPVGSATSCSVGGSGSSGALTWQELDRDLLNAVGLCNGPGRFTWPVPSAGVLQSDSAGAITSTTVPLSRLANMATASFLGRNTAGTGVPEVLSNATVSTMLRLPVFDVRAPAYGALCDNSTDDQTALVAAITAAQATGIGGRIIVSGRCKHSGTLTVTGSNVHIEGDGPGSTQLISTSTTLDQVVFSGGSYSDISGLSIVSSVTRTAGYALRRIGTIYGNDHNLFIGPVGGNGVFYDGTGGGTKLLDSIIHITGAFDGVTFTGGNDRWLSHLWIQGNQTSGSSCLVFHSTNGADMVDNTECVLFGDYGVKIIPGNGESVLWSQFHKVYADQDNLGGWLIAPTGTGIVNGITCVGCWAGTNGLTSSTTNGFTISGAGVDGVDFYDIEAVNNGGHGVSIDGASHVSLIGGYITGNSQQTINTKDGITLNNVSGVRIQGVSNVAYGAARHRYSLAVNGTSDNLQILGNDFRGFATAAILNTPGLASTREFRGNLPYSNTTESSIVTTASSGSQRFFGINTDTPEQPLHIYSGNTEDTGIGIGPNPDGSPGTESAVTIGYGGLSFGRGAGFLNVRPDSGASGEEPSFRIGANNHFAMMITKVGAVRVFSATADPSAVADSAGLWVKDTAAGDANLYAINELGFKEQITGLGRHVKTQFDKTSSTALSNVTNLSINVEAGKTYGITARLPTTSNVAGGIKFAIGGTATATSIWYEGKLFSGSTVTKTRVAAMAAEVCAATAVTDATCDIEGTIVVNAAGTLTVQFAQNVSNGSASSVIVGASLSLTPFGN